jgi:PTH1 family peptidyl-tRNA hydrolase
MRLIVGLGNPGLKYLNTRHNLGFLVLETLARKWKVSFRVRKKFASLVFFNPQKKIILAKPQLFMNESGIAVRRIAGFYKIQSEDVWVIHDDLDLPLGRLKIIKARGAAGHKGVFSVINQLGTIDFVRFRLGIAHPHAGRAQKGGKKVTKFDSQEETEDFVLSLFEDQEKDEVKRLIKKTIKAIELALEKGLDRAMNQYNF